jgi:hypothetical protein
VRNKHGIVLNKIKGIELEYFFIQKIFKFGRCKERRQTVWDV